MRVKIIKVLFVLNIISALIMACCIDSRSVIPMIVLSFNLLFLFLVEIASTREE